MSKSEICFFQKSEMLTLHNMVVNIIIYLLLNHFFFILLNENQSMSLEKRGVHLSDNLTLGKLVNSELRY